MLAGLLLDKSIVAVHMVLVEVIIDQPDGCPLPVELDLEHDGVLMNGPATHAHKDAGVHTIEGYLELLIESHDKRWLTVALIGGYGDDGRMSVKQRYARVATVLRAMLPEALDHPSRRSSGRASIRPWQTALP
jgi:hypothetical protein